MHQVDKKAYGGHNSAEKQLQLPHCGNQEGRWVWFSSYKKQNNIQVLHGYSFEVISTPSPSKEVSDNSSVINAELRLVSSVASDRKL